MAAPTRWGSFLSQAVAGVEARLDTILADNDDSAAQQKDAKPPAAASPAKQNPGAGPSRGPSNARPSDRLQEKLARALAAKAAGQKSDSAARSSMSTQGSPRQSIDAPSRNSTDSIDAASPAANEVSMDAASTRGSQEVSRQSQDGRPADPSANEASANGEKETQTPAEEVNDARSSADLQNPVTSAPKSPPAMVLPVANSLISTKSALDDAEDDGQAKQGDNALEEAQLQHQEEIHGYVERIDALEAKLQFLAREATESARKAALAAPAGSVEKKLAEKDQQIAQLMEEGKNLASTEQKHRAILKKLRAKIAEEEKELGNLQAAKAKTDKEVESLRVRARRADELERTHDDLQKRLDQTQKELGVLRPEIRSKDSTIAELRAQLQKAVEQADAMTAKVNEQAREQDKRRIADLEEEVAALKVEKNLVADRAKAQATELREKAERANERARALELELKAEVQVLEGKLEAMRIRAEEASSGVAGDSQAKLLRQIETLQTQYSIASENWQGIETTLLARITGLEKEKDEALRRESEMRRKAREATVRAKRHEEELEETKTKIPTIQQDVKSYQSQLDSLKKRAEEAEAALAKAKAEFDKEKQAWEVEREERQLLRQPVERPRSWLEDLPGGSFINRDSRPASPQLLAPQRTMSTDFLGISSLTGKGPRKVSAPSSNSDAGGGGGGGGGGFFSRRPSAQVLTRPSLPSSQPGGAGSGIFSPLSVFSPTTSEAPPHPHPLDREVQQGEDAFGGGETTTSSPQQQPPGGGGSGGGNGNGNGGTLLQDMVSVSTVAAGPSVQLVERMSAAIRRLESEKVAAREELARISKQRDEARAEIVALMREVEGNKAAAKQLAALEAEVAEVRERYETTLELLGEKSELVEELRADVEDVKAMYRDLVERTIK